MASEPFIDSRQARLVAGLVLILSVASLAYIHRDDLTVLTGSDAEPAVPANPELASCLSERYGPVDRMLAEGVIDDAKHTLFKQRAAAMCQDRFGG
ncbi:hypothetical protein [Nisaea denitrificans]|uniref:hypothetical protein n=1 Tax=Nisaea denitrificans TaxID=390877 RepID=UPI0004198C00|nr:hypothetical protein [Nisaea denitrificans]